MKPLHTLVLACAATAALFAAPYAAAHAMLKESSPAANSTVGAPKEISLVFNEKVEPAFSSAKLTDAGGKEIAASKAQVDGDKLTLAVPELAPGAYSVQWVGVGNDGHRRKGQFQFTVK
jgi:methionine-rich copper-binding protein CopC